MATCAFKPTVELVPTPTCRTARGGGITPRLSAMAAIRAIGMSILLLGAPAAAFEEGGFQLGMAQEEVLSIVRSRHDAVAELQSQPRVFVAASTGKSPEAVTFCDGLLSSYQYNVSPTPKAFARLVERETSARGSATYRVSTSETPLGEWVTISFTWRTASVEKENSFSQVGNDDPEVQVRYAGSDACHNGSKPD